MGCVSAVMMRVNPKSREQAVNAAAIHDESNLNARPRFLGNGLYGSAVLSC
jgi:hypothetical protein